jgi:hypothetical protein
MLVANHPIMKPIPAYNNIRTELYLLIVLSDRLCLGVIIL